MPQSLLQGGTLFAAKAERVLQALPQASVLAFHLTTGEGTAVSTTLLCLRAGLAGTADLFKSGFSWPDVQFAFTVSSARSSPARMLPCKRLL